MAETEMGMSGGLKATGTMHPLPFIRRQIGQLSIAVEKTKRCSTLPSLQGQNLMLFLLCLVCFANYLLRCSLGTAAVSMATEFNWDVHKKASLLSTFFWGYFCFNIAGAAAVARLGGSSALSVAAVGWSICYFSVPLATECGFMFLCLSMLAFGATEAPVMAASTSVIASCCSPSERGHVMALRIVSLRVGQCLASLLTPALCEYANWRAVFMVFGCISTFAALMWITFAVVEPLASIGGKDDSSFLDNEIAVDELNKGSGCKEGAEVPRQGSSMLLPLSSLRHPGLLCLIAVHCCMNSAAYFLMSWGPTYCTDVLGLPLGMVGITLVLPVAAGTIGALAGGAVMDKMLANGSAVIVARRRVLVSSFVGAAIAMAPLGLVRSVSLASILLCATFAFIGAVDTAIMANYVDIAPSNVAAVVGVGNTLATLPGAMGPRCIAALLDATGSWTCVFCVMSAIMLLGSILFAFYGEAEDAFKKRDYESCESTHTL